MIFRDTPVRGVWIVEPERREDERGFFARTWCQREFQAQGLAGRLAQCSTAYNTRKGTLRGLHYQAAPAEEAKLVRCTRGAIFDVVVDLRPASSTFLRHLAVVLSPENGLLVYVPEGCAHGYQTLADDTEVFYQMSEFHAPHCARGVRWDDPAFGIAWPLDERTISGRDRAYPDFRLEEAVRP